MTGGMKGIFWLITFYSASQCIDEPAIYDTDNTDLNSDFDEAELKRNLLKDVSR